MDNNMVSKIWVGISTTVLIFHYSSWKFKVTWKYVNFECQYIRTHSEEKRFKISNITFAILPVFIKILKLPYWILIESTTFDETIRSRHQMCFKMVHSNTKTTKSRVCYLHTTHSSALKSLPPPKKKWKLWHIWMLSIIQVSLNNKFIIWFWSSGLTIYFDGYSIASHPRCSFMPSDDLPVQWSVMKFNCCVTRVFLGIFVIIASYAFSR